MLKTTLVTISLLNETCKVKLRNNVTIDLPMNVLLHFFKINAKKKPASHGPPNIEASPQLYSKKKKNVSNTT